MPRLAALPRLVRQVFGIQFALGIRVNSGLHPWPHKKLKRSNTGKNLEIKRYFSGVA